VTRRPSDGFFDHGIGSVFAVTLGATLAGVGWSVVTYLALDPWLIGGFAIFGFVLSLFGLWWHRNE
jgi:hypothetical protein